MQLHAGTVIERYTVEALLGQGAFGAVYRARHDQLGTLHAIKVLTVASRGQRERLLQEGRIQAGLRHPNVVSVTDVLEVDGAPALVMELIEGPPLDELLRQVRLTLEQADELANGVLGAVAEAHRQGLVHRDLKPANIMLQVGPTGFVAKVTDFGLAKILRPDGGGVARTRSGQIMGTPCYMAPEQIRDSKNVDARADVFALGAILYELVTGRRAFPQEDIVDLFTAIAAGELTPPDRIVADLPSRMRDAIRGALDVDRDRRIQTVAALHATWMGRPTDVEAANTGPWSVAELQRFTRRPEAAPVGGETIDDADWSAPGTAPSSARPSMSTLDPEATPHFVARKSERPPARRSQAPAPTARATASTSTSSLGTRGLWIAGAGATLAVGGGVAILLLVAVVSAWVVLGGPVEHEATMREAPTADPASAAPVDALPEPEPGVAPAAGGPQAEPEPEPIAEPPPRAVTPVAAPARSAAAPAPVPAPAVPQATWRAIGDADPVVLVDAGGARWPPGKVPAGTYTIEATFAGQGLVGAGTIELAEGDDATLKCRKGFFTCPRQ